MYKLLLPALLAAASLPASVIVFNPTPGNGPAVNTTVTITDLVGGGVSINAAVTGSPTGDIRGLFFVLSGNSTSGMNCSQITGAHKTDCKFDEGDVEDLGGGANMNGVYDDFDLGIEIGGSGIGGGDDIQNTTLTFNNASITASRFLIAGVRLTSVGTPGRRREDSSKLIDYTPETGGSPVPEPSTLVMAGLALTGMGLLRRRSA